jgi:hypothetical protein
MNINYYEKYKKYKNKYLELKGGAKTNCYKRSQYIVEKDCINDGYFNVLYCKNIEYQNSLTQLDRYIIWFYTWDSEFVNNFLRNIRDIEIENNIIVYFFFYIKFYKLQKELFEDFKKNQHLILLYDIIYYYENIKENIQNDIICNINNNELNNNQKTFLNNILHIFNDDSNYEMIITEFIKYYSTKLNNIILNSPKIEQDIDIYRVINISSDSYNIGDDITINTFSSCSCSLYSNFFEYIIDYIDIKSYTLLKITCKKGMPLLFTNRETSYFGDHSYEIILPYNINFKVIGKDKVSLCGYSHLFDNNLKLDTELIDYLTDVSFLIDKNPIRKINIHTYKKIDNLSSSFIDKHSSSLLQIQTVEPNEKIKKNRVNLVNIIYDCYPNM